MGSNVFGTPITTETLMGMPEFKGKTIKIEDRAKIAMEMKNADGKDVDARKFGEDLWQDYRRATNGGDATICLLYNATGGPVTLNNYRDWSGIQTLSPYPSIIQNGQWGVYLHAQFSTNSCHHAIAYNGFVNGKGQTGIYVFGFVQRNDQVTNNRCAAEFNPFPASWGTFDPARQGVAGVFVRNYEGTAQAIASIGNGLSPLFEAIMRIVT